MTDDLVAWLRATLDAIESDARSYLELRPDDPDWVSVALADVEATRRLIDRHERAVEAISMVSSFQRGQDDGYQQACLDAIRDRAEVYADEPGYREEWRP